MKKLFLMLLVILFCGCQGLQIRDDANSKVLAYASGKGMGLAINKLAPKADAGLSDSWKTMMSSSTADPMPSAQIVAFYNSSLLSLSTQVKDPYGLMTDLGVLLTLYGAQYTDGKLTALNDVPRAVLVYFELGYSSGKQIALK